MNAGRRLLVLAAVLAIIGGCTTGAVDRARRADARVDAARAAQRAEARQSRADAGCHHIVARTERRTTPAPEDMLFLVDAVATAETCWDKITFTFESTGAKVPPGYEVYYEEDTSKFVEPTGGRLPLLGSAFLHVTFTPAQSHDRRGARPIQTYLGNLLLKLDGMAHTELVGHRQDGDGTVMWIIGLDEKRPFTVDASTNPLRVSVLVMR